MFSRYRGDMGAGLTMGLFWKNSVFPKWWLGAVGLCILSAGCGSSGQSTQSSQATGAGSGVLTGAGGGPGSSAAVGSGGSGGQGGGAVKLGPPYPIVLAHGFFGFNDFAGAGFLTYFYDVKEHLEADGEVVHTTSVDPFNSSDFRGAQLVERIEAILAESGHAKVNLIGHSQGGLDARVVANLRPDLVASVITVATPHNGSPIADVVLELVSDPNAQQILSDLVSLIGAPLYDQIGHETDVIKPLKLFSQPGIAEFNLKHPDEPGIFYASIAGRSDWHFGGNDCDPDEAVPFISAWNDEIDPIDPLLFTFEAVLDGNLLEDFANDGLVRVKDSRRGVFWGCLPADHTDQVGQIFGDSPGFANSWSYMDFYSALVTELRDRGL